MIPIRSLLRQIFTRHGLAEEFHEQEPLFLWEEAVGERIARLASPLRVREGIIFVEVPNHVLAQELSLLKGEYLRKLNKLLGEERVREIRFRVGGVLQEPAEEPVHLEKIPLTAEEEEEIDRLISDVEEARLREALRRFFITERRIEKARLARGFNRCTRCGVLYKGTWKLCSYCQLELGQGSA
ncbi:MAG: DUF721 domain-containing protein [Candidatus Acetothermia bacterium]|jgi:hypothetical protein|nr:DUF721 domain-containing protein [Candidatus Acetothermia bacterium]MDH7505646.1 DUF721 domain-containing protein [Candidatus Acetothermia bacterium]